MQTLIELFLVIKSRYFLTAIFLPGVALLFLDPGKNLGQFEDYGMMRQTIMTYLNAQVIAGLMLPLCSENVKEMTFDKNESFKISTWFWMVIFAVFMTIHLAFSWGIFLQQHGLEVFLFAFGAVILFIVAFVCSSLKIFRPKTEKPIDA